MAGPIDFKQLFNFDDSTPIDQMIDKIGRLNSAYDKLIQESSARALKYALSITEVMEAADKLEKQLLSLDSTEKAQQETIAKAAAVSDKLVKENEVYTKSLKETEEVTKLLAEQQEKLRSAKEKLKETTKGEAGSIKDLKDQLKLAVAEYERFGEATDQSVKDASIKRITELSKSIKESEAAVKTAKKGTELLSGSYYELNARVVDAKKRLKEMEGGMKGNSKEFKELQKFVQEGSAKLKEFDKVIGDNFRNVGNYESAFDALDNRIGGVGGQVKNLGKDLIALSANPWFLVIGAIVGTFALAGAAVKSFLTTTGEGSDILEQESAAWDQFLLTIKKGLTSAGGAIVEFFGAENLTHLVSKWISVIFPAWAAEIGVTAEKARELTREMQDLGNRIIEGVIKNATTELDVNERLQKSRDKLRYSDEQRLAFLKEAITLDEDRSRKSIDLEKNRLALRLQEIAMQQTVSDERNNFLKQEIDFSEEGLALLGEQIKASNLLTKTKEEIAEAVGKIVNQETEQIRKARRNEQQLIALILETEQRKRETARREVDSRAAINKIILDHEIKNNDLIVADQDSTLAERLTALNNAAQARVDALEIDKQTELNIVQRAAEDRIRAEGKVVTAALLAADQGLQNQRELIGKKYVALVEDVNRQTLEAVENNIFKQLDRDAQELLDDTATMFNEFALMAENDFAAGNLSIRQLLQDRKQISEDAALEIMRNQLDSLEIQKAALEQYGHDTSAIDKKISDTRLAIARETNDKTLEGLQAIKDASIDLAFATFDAVGEIMANSAERNIAHLEEQLAREEDSKAQALKIVGDDAQAREFIEAASAERSAEIQRQINAEKRKAAIFDKAVSITQATAQTALGVTRALGSTIPPLNFILAALVGAAGALQIATIASAPIPEFWKGTDYSPEGLAWIAERGREAIISPSGDAEIAEGKQLRYLERGSKVLDNATTESLLRDAERYGDGYLGDQLLGSFKENADRLSAPRPAIDSARIVNALGDHTREIVHAIKNAPQDVYDDKGYRHYENSLGARVVSLNSRYKLQ